MLSARMLETHPRGPLDGPLSDAIDALYACAQACTACADACLGEEMLANLRRCITLDLTCADICLATGAALSRQTEADGVPLRHLLEACIEVCRVCAEECDRHADMHEHCQVCAGACRACEEKCRAVLEVLPAR